MEEEENATDWEERLNKHVVDEDEEVTGYSVRVGEEAKGAGKAKYWGDEGDKIGKGG